MIVVVTNFTGNVTQNVTVPGNGADVFISLPSDLFLYGNSTATVVIGKAPLVDHVSVPPDVGGDSVVSITVVVDGQEVNVMDLQLPVEFVIPRSAPLCEEQRDAAAKCVWWDVHDNVWRTDNCVATPVTLSNGKPGTKCSCNHLTDFAVLLDQARPCGGETSSNESYIFFASVYALILLYCVVVTSRLQMLNERSTIFLRSQHLAIGSVALVRMISSIRYFGVLGDSLIFEGIITTLPYLLEFWIFTRLASTWLGMVQFTLLASDLRWEKIRPWLYGVNIVGSLFTIALFVAFLVQLNYTAALVGTIGIAVIYTLLSGIFLYYSGQLVKTMNPGSSSIKRSNPSLTKEPARCQCSPSSKILFGGRASALCFAMQALSSVLALVLERDLIPVFTALFLLFNCLALICLLLVYYGAVSKAFHPKVKMPSNGSTRNIELTREASVSNFRDRPSTIKLEGDDL